MSELWKQVLALSLSGTILILGIFLFCRLFQKKMSRRWQYYIWLVAVARLLIPFSGDINLVGKAFSAAEQYAGQQVALEREAQMEQKDSETLWTIEDSKTDPIKPTDGMDDAPSKETGNLWTTAGFSACVSLVWLMAAVGFLIRRITVYQSFLRYLRAGSKPADLELLEAFGRIAGELRIKGSVELLIHPLVPSPLLAGFFRPAVVLPTADLSEEDFRYTVLHELIHYRRRDVLYKWLVQVAVCLHWFNPFVWLLGRETDRTCELSCDEAVIETLTDQEKRCYGDTLLRAAGQKRSWKGSIPAVTLHESGKLLKGRLEAILMYRKRTLWMKLLSLTLAVAAAGSAAVLGTYAKPEAEKVRFVSGGRDFLLEDGTSVIERDQVFYILCDGLTEEEIPHHAGVVDGTMILVVHRGISTSVTLSDDRSSLLQEAEPVCKEMVQRGTLSEEDAALILGVAGELQESEPYTPPSDSFDGNYYQSVYYEAPYLFFVGYDLTEEAAGRYPGTELTLESGEKLHVSFADEDQKWMEDEAFLSVLQTLFSEFRTKEGKRVSHIRRPIVRNVEEVGWDTEGLAETYYAEKDMGRFSVMIQELSEEKQKEYLETAFRQGHAALFSIILGGMYRSDHLEESLVDSYLARSYDEKDVASFSILTGYLSKEKLQEWYDRISRQERPPSPYDVILWELLNDTDEDLWEEEDDWYF